MEDRNQQRYKDAHKRVKEIKGFYIHLIVFIIMNTFILVNIYISKRYDNENFWEFGSFFTFFAWGIGLLIHGFSVSNYSFLWGENWEERKIKEFMDKEGNE
ncbi:hypothetical protein GTQ40_17855 [Flavobacteriaceae bacterium R38]|nr:hypothetical protein [Flavobacteriaceae bacterium R38]